MNRIWDIMKHITNGIAFIHFQKEVHQDLQPRNSMANLPTFIAVTKFNIIFSKGRRLEIADFGLTMEGNSQLAHATRYSRGTPCYRAPELIRNDFEPLSKYTNKVDIWALGCFFFELLFTKKAFANDIAVRDYSQNNALSWKPLELPFEHHTILDETDKLFLLKMIHEMLELDPIKRPAALLLQRKFLHQTVNTLTHPRSASKSSHLEMSLTMSMELESLDVENLQIEPSKPFYQLVIGSIQGWKINVTNLPMSPMILEKIVKLYKTAEV